MALVPGAPAGDLIGATRTRYLLTGLSGSISKATRSLIWSIVRTPLVPKRGMFAQASADCGLKMRS